jgi:hypothetical protein
MCQVQILTVSGIVPVGAAGPTQLRVTGRLSQCASGQVVVSSSVTAASAPTAPGYGMSGDGFVVVLPITAANVACGDAVTVVAQCYQNQGCQDTYNGPMHCCGVVVSAFDAVVLPGSLTPSQIRVSGSSHGCASSPFILNDPVIVSVSFGMVSAQSGPVSVDPVSGSFFVQIPVPQGAVVQCDDTIAVDAWCSTNPACKSPTVKQRLDCPQCARAEVHIVSVGPCVGTPPTQPITLGATIEIAKGATRFFRWSYGDGTTSPVFQIDNSTGIATTQHIVPPYANPAFPASHPYPPGTYSAELIVTNQQGGALECDRIPIAVTASCDQCPNVTVSASSSGPCVNGKRHVTLQTNVSPPFATTVFQWAFGDGQMGMAAAATSTGTWPNPSNPAVNEHDYSPGTYTATLTNVLSPGCPPVTVQITVDACPTACCPQVGLDAPRVTGCAPGSVVASLSAQLQWMQGCTAVAPTAFEWTLHTPNGTKYQKSTSLPSTDTTAGWHDIGGNPAVVQFPTGGNYSISVSAIIPGVNLPCNPTDNASFPVPPCCPQLIGPLNASAKPGDPCTWMFSAQTSNPNNAPVTFQWSFQDGGSATTSVPQTEHTYMPGASISGMTTLTMKAANCPDQSLSVSVTPACSCPTIGAPSAVVTGCLPGTPMVTLSTSVTPPVANSFAWTVTTPGGSSFTKMTMAASTTDGTGDGAWTDASTGATGPLNLGTAGGYAVSVTASGPNLSPTCMQPRVMSFSVPTCTTGTSTLSCSFWCALAGLFLIAVPISAYISTVAHCLLGPPWNIALQGGIIATAIGVFIAVCGVCCVWLWLLIGAALGVIATIIAAYWLGFPGCWYVALPILIGFVALGVGMAIYCARRASASGSPTASSSSGLSSASGAPAARRLEWNATRMVQAIPEGASSVIAPNIPAGSPNSMVPAGVDNGAEQRENMHSPLPVAASMPPSGLGDWVHNVTQAIGVRPCAACQQRAAWLNRMVQF